jgi:hypothetical protein
LLRDIDVEGVDMISYIVLYGIVISWRHMNLVAL